jgi:hypothetical protein
LRAQILLKIDILKFEFSCASRIVSKDNLTKSWFMGDEWANKKYCKPCIRDVWNSIKLLCGIRERIFITILIKFQRIWDSHWKSQIWNLFQGLIKSLRLKLRNFNCPNTNLHFGKHIILIMIISSWLCNYWDNVEIRDVLIKCGQFLRCIVMTMIKQINVYLWIMLSPALTFKYLLE